MNEEKIFYIRILSPVHVGCDEVYEPMGFVVDENTCTLTAFDPLEFFRHLGQQDKDRFTAICRKGSLESIMELYKFMRKQRFDGYALDVCRGFVEHYKKTLSASATDSKKIQQELNNFTIARTAFSPVTQQPYIPGSAIKGALRTAYLNHLAAGESVSYDRKDSGRDSGKGPLTLSGSAKRPIPPPQGIRLPPCRLLSDKNRLCRQ